MACDPSIVLLWLTLILQRPCTLLHMISARHLRSSSNTDINDLLQPPSYRYHDILTIPSTHEKKTCRKLFVCNDLCQLCVPYPWWHQTSANSPAPLRPATSHSLSPFNITLIPIRIKVWLKKRAGVSSSIRLLKRVTTETT